MIVVAGKVGKTHSMEVGLGVAKKIHRSQSWP